MKLEKYSFGIGDRFGMQGKAQLAALVEAKQRGIDIVPVWNKSNREHTITGTTPASTRAEALNAVKEMKWQHSYYVDADHINLRSVDSFMDSSDFFTLDVADSIGKPCTSDSLDKFVRFCDRYKGKFSVKGIERRFEVTSDTINQFANKYLRAIEDAAEIYKYIADAKGENNFITEVSLDETSQPQNPLEIFFILAAIAHNNIPAQTIAPRFLGKFNKGVDYSGDVSEFERQFNDHIAVLAFAVKEFGLPDNLKLSIHSGSDKFSIYAPIKKALKHFGCGLHVKTAGTTWLEEITGLASVGGEGLQIAKQIYRAAFDRIDELCAPYSTVVDIDRSKLPWPQTVEQWSSDEFVNALRHVRQNLLYNPSLRQLFHLSYKVAAEMGDRYTEVVKSNEEIVAQCVKDNISNHIVQIFE